MGMGKSCISVSKNKIKFFSWFLGCLFAFNLGLISFGGERVSAAFVPTLSVSAWKPETKVKGSDVLKTANKTTEASVWFQVQTNNRTGYTASFSTDTDNTDLVNSLSSTNSKITSVKSNYALADFPVNTWGYKLDSGSYAPIPGLSNPVNIFQTTKPNPSEYKGIYFGMKLGDDLEGGTYENKIIFSIVTNSYEKKALMVKGERIQSRLRSFNENGNKTKRFKRSATLPGNLEDVKNIEDDDSDFEIKLWHDKAAETAYYYSESEKIFLNEDCNAMFADDIFGQYGLKNLEEIELTGFDTSKVKNMSLMFSYLKNLTKLDLTNFDTSNVTSMWKMFFGSEKLTNLNVSNFNTKKVENMEEMFSGLKSIEQLNLSSFDTSSVTDMKRMFAEDRKITNLELTSFDTSNVKDMSGMFYGMTELTNLNVSHFDTSKVTDMNYMFFDMSKIASLDLSNFDTSKVTNMKYMFYGTKELVTLDISNFDTSNVTNMDSMFFIYLKNPSDEKLERIYVNNDFDTSKVVNASYLFYGRKKLRGGNGSFLAEPGTADKTWLRVDRPGVQGYFTRKP
jgi:hypothetical protein